VVPIYNVEAFLRDCLDSVHGQTYRDLQVILVDDGCTDGSVAIAEEFVAADPRFQLIRQANAGLSAARNTGVLHATGEFLAFVDSDDVLAAHAYETLILAMAGGADFASGGVHRFTSRGHHSGYPHDEAISGTNLNAHVSRDHRLLRDRTVWNKVFRRSFWDAQGFEFPPGRLFEDVPVCVPAHARATSVAVVDEPSTSGASGRARSGPSPSRTTTCATWSTGSTR
jgi:CDP-glycerol glycerophosphotransferase